MLTVYTARRYPLDFPQRMVLTLYEPLAVRNGDVVTSRPIERTVHTRSTQELRGVIDQTAPIAMLLWADTATTYMRASGYKARIQVMTRSMDWCVSLCPRSLRRLFDAESVHSAFR